MRVGIYFPAYPPEAGGGYTFERDLLEAFLELSPASHHEFTIFSPSSTPVPINPLAESNNVSLYNVGTASSIPARFIRKARKLLDWRGEYLSDLNVALDKTAMDCLWFATPGDQPVNIPYILTIWDLQHRLQPWFPEVGVQREWQIRERAYSSMIQRASYVVTGTIVGQAEISSFYQIPRERIRILPLPTPVFAERMGDDQVRSILEKFRLSPGFLFYPAQFWPHKNHANLLLALKILRDQHNLSLELVLVGSEKGNKEYVQSLAGELGIETAVHFLGFVSQQELIALYQSAFALTFMTFFGPENLPPLEAFGMGCPVIASRVHGAEEQLGDTALLVDPSNPSAIAAAVVSLINDSDKRTELIERGYKRASAWTSKDFVRGIFSVLDEFESIRRAWK